MRDSVAPRPEIGATPPAHHGALNYGELEMLGLDPAGILDFSTNINPYGPAPAVAEAIANTPLDCYPDRESLALRRALANHLALSPDQIVAGNGTAELLWMIAFAFIAPGDQVMIAGPTFGEYARCASLMGGRIELVEARAEEDFAVDPACIERALQSQQPRLAFICNPNNPTGASLEPGLIQEWAAEYSGTLFVVDEAYLSFTLDLGSALSFQLPNVLVLRSMTKDYALAGLRLGYAAGSRPAIEAIARVRPPWNVNALAQSAGLAALQDQTYLQMTLAKLRAAKDDLVAGLRRIGLRPIPSAAHYFVVNVSAEAVGAAGLRAGHFRRRLLAKRLQVRDCASFGMPAHIRIATRRPEENARLLAAIKEMSL